MHYLDNAATTSVRPEVARRICEALACFANPSSLYAPGLEAEELIAKARSVLAAAFGHRGALDRRRPEVVFTASGTEGNNIAILGAARARKGWGSHIVATGYEHPSVQNTVRALAAREGFTLTEVMPGPDGSVNPEEMIAAVGDKTVLVTAMAMNNETGALLDTAALAAEVKRKNPRCAFHVDAVQAFCKLPVLWAAPGVDSVAVSGHKLHAPKGIGALYLRKGHAVEAPFTGGEQEGGVRPGTENTPYIAGFGLAVQLAGAALPQPAVRAQELRAQLVQGLEAVEGVVFNSPENAWPGIVNFSLPGIKSETMLHFLEQREVYVSSGSACAKGQASHTLTAMALPKARVDSALRVSFSAFTTEEDVEALLAGLQEGAASLARVR